MKKRVVWVTSVTLLILAVLAYITLKPGGILSSTELGHLVSLLGDFNSIELITKDDLKIDNVKIYWECQKNKRVLLRDGKKNLNRIIPCYGGNLFTVYYDDIKKVGIWHVKYNNWHYHKYIFILYKENGKIRVNLNITGPDEHIEYVN
jgi:hypothetical protein